MGKNSAIEWCHHTVNFWWGCAMALLRDGTLREECRHCYALLLSKLFSRGKATWGSQGNRWIRHVPALRELAKLDESARKRNVRELVFINSMSDTFEDRADLNDALAVLFAVCPVLTNLDILLLTKRPQNVRRMVPAEWLTSWPTHVWIGTTVGTQAAADEAIPELLKIPARVRFLSCEPLLGPVSLQLRCPRDHDNDGDCDRHPQGCPRIHWVICGGESGQKARPMHPDWARSLRDQCQAAGVPFFFKQWGDNIPFGQTHRYPEPIRKAQHAAFGRAARRGTQNYFGARVTTGPNGEQITGTTPGIVPESFAPIGKKLAGRLLDGVEHNAFPEVGS